MERVKGWCGRQELYASTMVEINWEVVGGDLLRDVIAGRGLWSVVLYLLQLQRRVCHGLVVIAVMRGR